MLSQVRPSSPKMALTLFVLAIFAKLAAVTLWGSHMTPDKMYSSGTSIRLKAGCENKLALWVRFSGTTRSSGMSGALSSNLTRSSHVMFSNAKSLCNETGVLFLAVAVFLTMNAALHQSALVLKLSTVLGTASVCQKVWAPEANDDYSMKEHVSPICVWRPRLAFLPQICDGSGGPPWSRWRFWAAGSAWTSPESQPQPDDPSVSRPAVWTVNRSRSAAAAATLKHSLSRQFGLSQSSVLQW